MPSNTPTLGVVMDPIEGITPHKDTTLAMLLEAQRRGWAIRYMRQEDLDLVDGRFSTRARPLAVRDSDDDWFDLGDPHPMTAGDLDAVLMRKDPPFDLEYVYTTYLLERAEAEGAPVFNRPRALRDVNEKAYTARFPDLCTPTMVSRDMGRLRAFLREHGKCVVKPLAGMGGESVFVLEAGDPNTSVVLTTLTDKGRRFTMAQRYIPEIRDGDKRILLIDGEPYPRALARIPAEGETRGNIAAGGRGVGVELSARDREICDRVGAVVREMGLGFVGLDVIGDYLTEINVTSPTCVRELDRIYDDNIAARYLDYVARTAGFHR